MENLITVSISLPEMWVKQMDKEIGQARINGQIISRSDLIRSYLIKSFNKKTGGKNVNNRK